MDNFDELLILITYEIKKDAVECYHYSRRCSSRLEICRYAEKPNTCSPNSSFLAPISFVFCPSATRLSSCHVAGALNIYGRPLSWECTYTLKAVLNAEHIFTPIHHRRPRKSSRRTFLPRSKSVDRSSIFYGFQSIICTYKVGS